jgi:hypothetical protein
MFHDIKGEWREYSAICHFEKCRRKPIWFLYNHLKQILNCLICRWRGHKLVDCSSAGPDSGDMDHYCERCGQFWSVPLY